MKKTLQVTSLIAGVMFVLSACHKPGCMDDAAINYDEKANATDFSCTYAANVFFWADPVTSDSLVNIEGHSILRFEIDGELVDSVGTSTLNSLEGICGTTSTMTIQREFTGNNTWSHKYRIKGTGFTTIYEGYVTLNNGECTEIKLD